MPPSRDLHKAKKAYEAGDIQASIAAHSASAKERHQHERGQYIKSAVYGGLDGIITTFAVVAGAAGAKLTAGIVLILGFANLIADGLSMAIGDYLSTKSEQEYERAERRREEWEIEHYPEGEKRELVELYVDKGLAPQDAETIVAILSKNKDAWIDVMMVEELGIFGSDESPLKNALVTFFSFGLFGFVPILVYVAARFVPLFREATFEIACLCTGLTLFALGALKVKITGRNWFKSGLEMLLVGGVAAAAAYAVGALLGGLA
ncbi:MAG: VIT1/CCC1 transporter family protein [Pirellulales bacterium]|nr:VIT1/CCC1 transporter family protein [Pirellulales bacterium]